MATGITSSITGNATYSSVLQLTAYDDVLNINNATLSLALPAGDIELMQGNDTVTITDSTVNGATGVAIKLGSGNDTVTISNSTIQSSIRLDSGDDYILINGSTQSVVTMNALNPDQTSIDTDEELTTLLLGKDNDILELCAILQGNGVINFGTGSDTLVFNGGRLDISGGIANLNNLVVTTAGGSTTRDIILYGADNLIKWNGNFAGGKTITLEAVDGIENTVVTFEVDNNSVSQAAFSINNRTFIQTGTANWELNNMQAGPVFLANYSTITISNMVFRNNNIGLQGENTVWNISNSNITDSTKKGGDITGGSLAFDNVSFKSNKQGGIVLKGAILSGKAVSFLGNTAVTSGGGLEVSNQGQVSLSSVTFSKNTAFGYRAGIAYGGGLYIVDGGKASFYSADLVGNKASASFTVKSYYRSKYTCYRPELNWYSWAYYYEYYTTFGLAYGGGVYLSSAEFAAQNLLFSQNVADHGYGGGMYVDSASIQLQSATFAGNTADRGGGIYACNAQLNIQNANFSCNTGGAIAAERSIINLTDVTFSNNTGNAITLVGNNNILTYTVSEGKTIENKSNEGFLSAASSAVTFMVSTNALLIIGQSNTNIDSISKGNFTKNGLGTLTIHSAVSDGVWNLTQGLTQLLSVSRNISLNEWTIGSNATLQLSEVNDIVTLSSDKKIGTLDFGGGSDIINTGGYHLSDGLLLISTLTISGGGKVSSEIRNRVEGDAFNLTLDNVTLESTITGGTGNDTIAVTTASVISGTMNLGNGKNSITATDVTFDASLTTGSGTDTITVTGTAIFNRSVQLGKGADILSFKDVTFKDNLDIGGTATQDNSLQATGTALFQHDVNFGAGNDTLSLNNATFERSLVLGAGNDTLSLNYAAFRDLLDLGAGNNTITVLDTLSTSNIVAQEGNDIINLSSTTATHVFNGLINLGAGTNSIYINGKLDGEKRFLMNEAGSTSLIIYRGASVISNTISVMNDGKASLRPLTLDWSDIDDLDKVRILISSDPSFATYEFNLELYNRVKSFTINMEEGYFYQFQANDEDGWAIRYLTDEIAPDQVTGLSTELEESGTVAHWDATHDDWGGNGVAQYRVQVAIDSAFANVVLEQLVSENRLAMDSVPVGNYFYRVQAIDFTGNTGEWSAGYAFVCEIPDTTAPTAPKSLAAQVNGGKVNLDWGDSTDAESGLDHYLVTYAANSSFANAQTRQVTASELKNLALADGDYHWKVQAVDKAGNASAETAGTTFLIDTTAPAAVSGLAATLNKNTIDFSWQTTTDNLSGVAKYELEISGKSDFSTLVASKSGATLTSFSLSFTGSGTYYYRVRATDGAGNASAWTTKSVAYDYSDTEPPTVPTNLRTTKNGTKVTFAWNASADVDSGVAGYELKVVRNGKTETVRQVTGTSATLDLPESDYAWSVTARDNFGNASAAANGEAFQVLLSHAAPAEVALGGTGVAEMATGTSGDEAFRLTPDGTWGTYHVARWNGGSDRVSLAGFNRFQDAVSGNGGYDLLQLPDGDNALLYRDLLTPKASGADGASRLAGLAEVAGGSGRDVIDLTDAAGGYTGDILLKGGAGDDHLWAGAGDDILVGGAGDDDLRGGAGADTYLFDENWGCDTILDDGGTLVFDNALQGKLTFSAVGDGTRITDGTNTLDLTWQVTAAEVEYADIASLTELRRDTIKGFLA